ncbi:5-methyltetrahydrofolate--homocysteine methyltransferase [Geothermobacter hydrogeniphilus]|uniref:methionine synthase n=1 Tax=Geothermobacter hydrogeniphilus TaxID=1969733 RepID=A0A2K2HEH4_9BACT|nr:dihydropteroate synthase [Geothermobacter hydrogeniphilus]PNU21697.1 5-methyltetrahydrofolate--homocysteine methyltransferase [Geothermobacter hydrogeniphilus]
MKAQVASLYQAVDLQQEIPPLLIGERCNPNGSKAFREALLAEDWDACLKVALDQEARGAQLLDLCVAYTGRDEKRDMLTLVKTFAGSCKAPLMLDSTSPETLEAALPLYPGRAIINSINLEDGGKNLDRVCRLAKKYGAAVVALTITEEGMALSCEQKVAAAKRIFDLAVNRYGLRPQDLLFDLLTFTVGSGDEKMVNAAVETLDAIRRVKQELPGVSFTLGVSNISFGLRPAARKVLNSVFLHEAVAAGLNTAIVDAAKIIPLNSISEQDREVCYDLLFNRGHDRELSPLMRFIEHFEQAADNDEDEPQEALRYEEQLRQRVLKGDREGLEDLLSELRGRWRPLDIINNLLVPAMREVGELFGRGELLLPFVLQSAEVMKRSVALLEPYMERIEGESRTSLLLATVAGDVHDIGKNLVDIILSNNGYQVHNIGTKVPAEEIIARAQELQPDVIGLSGLLVKSALLMKENLAQFRQAGLKQPVLLGGAALTARYVADDCVPCYDAPVVYCADAFAGLKAMREFEAGTLAATRVEVREAASGSRPGPRAVEIDRKVAVPEPPFLGSRTSDGINPAEVFPFVNEQALFRGRWGYRRGKLSAEEYAELVANEVLPTYERFKCEAVEGGLLQPRVAWGYFRCRGEADELVLEHEGKDFHFAFPRQGFAPHLCISDFFHSEEEGGDVAGLFVVTLGPVLAEKTRALYEADNYKDYLLWHGFGVEVTDALAEYWHRKMRFEMGIAEGEPETIGDYVVQRYRGSRYGFGYPACPDLELQRPTFELLRPERIGVSLTENCEMVPEMTTSALVAHHPQAKYFAV